MADEPTGIQPVTLPDPVQDLLKEYGFEVSEKGLADMKREFGVTKADMLKYKADAKNKSELEKELQTLKDAEEQRRQATLTETDKIKEERDSLKKLIADKDAAIQQMQRTMTMKEVMFESLKDKPLTTIREKLYQAAASAQEWADAEDLKAIFLQIDADLENDLKASRVTLPAPGDGAGGAGKAGDPGADKYDENYFRILEQKSRGIKVP